jgi:hypothetical protein
MTASPLPLEQILNIEGDALYRLALLLGGSERAAAKLLQELARRELRSWPHGDDQPNLFRALFAYAKRNEQPRTETSRREQPPTTANLPPLYRRILLLPLEQRMVLGLRLFFGYDEARLVVAGFPAEEARTLYTQGLRALAPTAGVEISDYGPEDLCDQTRAALREHTSRVSREPVLRGHLATCHYCRAYDQAWSELTRLAEQALRAQLRLPTLPATLRARMLSSARPPASLNRLNLRYLLPPVAVIALIGVLILPGFWRNTTVVVERTGNEGIDPQTLVQQALTLLEQPPNEKSGVYRARYETLWFFDNTTFAPIRAEYWIDSRNPSRHRIEIAHNDGGAPYELQVGDGEGRMAYHVTPTYATSLYSQPLAAKSSRMMAVDSAGQNEARLVRLNSGPWALGPAYLRAAAEASDLRALGRQRDGDRTVQVLSYSGTSPLGRPIDAPGATAERITVLLALDAVDGRLRRATELAGPSGAAQTSRTTWRLVEEEWILSDALSDPLLNMNRVWEALGEEAPAMREAPLEPRLPLLDRESILSPAALLRNPYAPNYWLPTQVPTGTDRAMVIGNSRLRSNEMFETIAYFGPDRSLFLYHGDLPKNSHQEDDTFGTWNALLSAGRMQRYTIALQLIDSNSSGHEWMRIEARGFTRAELQAVVESLRPFDLQTFLEQETFFVQGGQFDPTARAALLELLRNEPQLAADQVLYSRVRTFQRTNGSWQLVLDPYTPRPQSDTVVVEEWVVPVASGTTRLVQISDVGTGTLVVQNYSSPERSWYYNAYASELMIWEGWGEHQQVISSVIAQIAFELLAGTEPLMMQRDEDDSLVVSQLSAINTAFSDPRADQPLIRDLPGETALQRLRIGADDNNIRYDTFVGDGSLLELSTSEGRSPSETSLLLVGETLVESLSIEAVAAIPLAEAPAALRTGEPPQVALVRDYTERGITSIALRSLSFVEALEEWDGPAYLLPEATIAQPTSADLGEKTVSMDRTSSIPGLEATAHGLAVRFGYVVPTETGEERLWISTGDGATLRAFFRSQGNGMWRSSYPLRTIVAGQNTEIWVMEQTSSDGMSLFAEVDGSLIIIEGRSPWLMGQGLTLLADLRLVP